MRVLIIKLTSMGDLMHALPALTDAVKAFPDIEFDWVVDKAFADVPKWHPSVRKVITTSHRHWRQSWLKNVSNGEIGGFYKALNADGYDAVIDMQNNLKSALVSLLRKGPVHGLDKYSCREKPAYLAYRHKINVNPNQHAVERMRQILAKALNYPVPETAADYGVDLSHCQLPLLNFAIPKRFLMLVHNASWLTKLWPVNHWQSLTLKAVDAGYSVLIPSGNDEEYQRALEIAAVSDKAYVLPRLSLDNIAAIMQKSDAALCSDTGLAHMAAMMNKPAITLYGSTDTHLIGTHGQHQQHLITGMSCSPCYKRRCPLESSKLGQPVCMSEMQPDQVWHRLDAILQAQ
ncbi:MAG TPA: lipopolysaccharide heptosyltransferase I [Methylophaga aminisulfidivorans]|uniref:Lipopolysaccharide heptosyltransferase 1 n=2 Tax=root TaxID=1 RepID=A0A7C1W205_9GAMM|nr:lipopolysaccharide heptosyltransferase I [Methylophaga aminisulfidivorans]